MPEHLVGIVIFTRDLRLHDQPALADAVASCAQVVPAFVFDDGIIGDRRVGANRWRFLLDSLRDLDRSLREADSRLIVRRGVWVHEVARLVRDTGAGAVFMSDDWSARARWRATELDVVASAERFAVHRHPGVTVVPPDELHTQAGGEFKVFTPYHRVWLAAPWRGACPVPGRIATPSDVDSGSLPALAEITDAQPSAGLAPGGETSARAALRAWTPRLPSYADVHNDLGAHHGTGATSRISAALHFGCLSPLEVASRLRGREGAGPFVRQLCWRDFFHQVLAADPTRAWRDVRPRGDEWDVDDESFETWARGRTGYPVVDAAMRQLRTEGFMHNRARMIVASFLTKDLYQDWRRGAAHFATLLADADVACNQLNWQWVAGTGNDPNSYRVFNPTLQGQRFDPTGDYIRRHVAELAEVMTVDIHDPPPLVRAATGYPAPVVLHREAVSRYRLIRAKHRT